MDPNAVANQAISGSAKEQMAREVSVMLSANTGAYQQEMKHAADQTNKLADALHNVEKAYTGTLKFIGKFSMGLGATMQASAAGAVWSAAQFEESFARVAKTTGLDNTIGGQTGRGADFMASLGIGSNDLQTFQNDIRALSTDIPVSVQELSYLADVAGTLGVESENLVLFADTAAKLGAAINDLGSDQAIAGLANLIGAFGRADEEVVNLGSSLADLANHTRGNASEILQFSDRMAGTAVQVSMTAEEVMGLGAAVSAIGARPELGASAIVQTMNTISLAIQSTGSELDKFSRAMGMSADDLQEMWKEDGATAVLTRLLTTLNAQGEEAVSTLRALGLSGVGTTQILGGLAAQLGTYNDAMATSIEASEKGSAVAELAAVRFDTVYKAMQRFAQSTAEVFRSIGVGFLAPFKVLIDTGTNLVNVFNAIPAPLRVALGLFVGLGGAVLVAAGAFTIFFATFHGLFALIYIAPKLVELLSAAIQKLGPGTEAAVRQLDLMAQRLRQFSTFVQELPGHLRSFFQTLRQDGVFATLGRGLDAAKEKMQAFWQASIAPRVGNARMAIEKVFGDVWPKITGGLRSAGQAVAEFSSNTFTMLRRAFDGLGGNMASLRRLIGSTFNDALLSVGVFASQSGRLFGEFTDRARESFAQVREGVAQAFRGMMTSGEGGEANLFGRLVASARTGMSSIIDIVSESAKNASAAFREAFREGWPAVLRLARETAVRMGEAILDGLKRLGSTISSAIPDLVTYARVLGSEFMDNLRDAFSNAGPRLVEWAKHTSGELSAAFALGAEEMGRRLRRAYVAVASTLADVFTQTMPRLMEGMRGSIGRIAASITETFNEVSPRVIEWARTTAGDMSAALILGFDAMRQRVKRVFTNMVNDAFDLFTSLGARIGSAVGPALTSFGARASEAFKSFVDAARPALTLSGEIFATLVERGVEGFQRLIPGIRSLAKTLGGYLVDALELVGRATRWVFKELFVKETWEIMKVALRTTGQAAMLAAKPFIYLGEKIAQSVGKDVADAILGLRAGLKTLATDGAASSVAQAFTLMSVQADALKRNLMASFPVLSSGLQEAKKRALELGIALKTAMGPALVNMLAAIRVQITALGVTMGMMLAPLGVVAVAVLAVGAAIWGWEKWKSRNDEITDSLYALADAAGLVTDEIERMSWATANTGLNEFEMAVGGQNVIAQLRSMSGEGADQLSFTYAASLVRGGQPVEEVIEHVNELRRLAGLGAIEFEYTFRELSSGEGYREWMDASRGASQGFFTDQLNDTFDSELDNLMGFFNRTPKDLDTAFGDMIRQAKDIGDSNIAALVTVMHDLEMGIDEAVAEGIISPDIGRNLRRDLADEVGEFLPGRHEAGAISRGGAWLTDFLSMGTFNTHRDNIMGERLSKIDTGFGLPQDTIANLVSDEFMNMEDLEPIRQSVRDVTGEIRDLDSVVRDMDSEQFAQLRDRIAEVAAEFQDSRMTEKIAEINTNLGRQLFRGRQEQPSIEHYDKFTQNLLETYHLQVGHVRALEEMNIELDESIASTGRWSQETEQLANAIEKVRDEYAQIKLNDLRLELSDVAPTQQLQHIKDRLRELTDSPWDVAVRVQYEEQFRQTYQQQVQNFRQTMQQYDALIDRREETVRSHNESLERMSENHQRQMTKSEENHQRSMAKSEENHQRQLTRGREDHGRRLQKMEESRDKAIENSNKQYEKRLEDINKAEKKALEDRVEQQANAFNAIQRIQATPTADLGAMLSNIQAQNAAMSEMAEGLRTLNRMGLSSDVMENIGLNDPKNFAQVRRMVEMAVSDPSMIQDINNAWKQRLDISEAFVKEADTSEIEKQFDEQRKNAKEALDEQIKDIRERHTEQVKDADENFARSVQDARDNFNRSMADARENYDRQVSDANENYQRQVEQANENNQRQLENIAESLAKLGEDTFETLDELIEKALASTLDNLIAAANAIERWELEYLGRAPRTPEALTAEEVDIRYNITDRRATYDDFYGLGSESADRIRVGFRDGVPVTWRELRREIASGTSSSMDTMAGEITGGVTRSHVELNRISDQDSIWNTARASGETGARRLADGITTELEHGTGRINNIMEQWGFGITSHLNPVLEAIGENPIQVQRARRAGGGGPAPMRAADGAVLPDQAKIQRPGTLVQWAEPETGGEAFIPLASSKRQRSLSIWKETGRLLGAEFADGGFLDLPDFSKLGDIGDVSQKAVVHTNDKVEKFLSEMGFGAYDADGNFEPRSGQYGGVQPWVAWSGNVINGVFGPLPGGIGGVGSRSGPSDHPSGHALDFMVGDTSSGHALGDRISRFLLANWVDHAVKYLIWKQRITSGGAWKSMAGRGSRTADHWDHPHVSYNARPGPNYDGPATPVNLALPKIAKEATPPPGISQEGQRPSGTLSGSTNPRTAFTAMADGGIDRIPAWMADGEFVMTKDAHAHYGTEMMESLNAKRFANGGAVGNFSRNRGREPMGGGNQTDLVNALTKALANASMGRSETNNWDVKVEAKDTKGMIRELEAKKRLSRLTRSGQDD